MCKSSGYMDTTAVYAPPFCVPVSQLSGYATKSGDEAEVSQKSLPSSAQPHASRINSFDEDRNHSCSAAMGILAGKMEKFPGFIPRSLQGTESLNDDQAAVPTIIPVSTPVVITAETPKSYVLKNVSPYVQQQTAALQSLSEASPQPPTHLISGGGSLKARSLPLSHHGFPVTGSDDNSTCLPLAAVTHSGVYQGRRTTDPNLCRYGKQTLEENQYENGPPRRLRLKTADGPTPGFRSSYGRSGWHEHGGPSRQSAFFYPGSGAATGARVYTRPAPSVPLLPLGHAYNRNVPRRFATDNFSVATVGYDETYSKSTFNCLQGFRSGSEGNDQVYNSSIAGNAQIGTSSTFLQASYSGSNITYTAAGTAPPPKTFRGDPDTVVICSSTTSGRNSACPYSSVSNYTCAESDADYTGLSMREMYESSTRGYNKSNRKTLISFDSTNAARSAGSSTSQKQENRHSLNGYKTSLVEESQQVRSEDNRSTRTTITISTPSLSLCPQLARTQVSDAQKHLIPDNSPSLLTTACSVLDVSCSTASGATATTTVPITETAKGKEFANGCIQSSKEAAGSISREISTSSSSIPASISEFAADESEYSVVPAEAAQPPEGPSSQDAYYLDEDSLLENLPKFGHCHSSRPGELRSANWSPLRPLSTRRNCGHYESAGHFSRQRKQILQMKGRLQREAGREKKSNGLPPVPAYQHTSSSGWRRHVSNSNHSCRNHPARQFSTSDGYVRSRERNGYDRTAYMLQSFRNTPSRLSKSSDVRSYMGNSDRSRDRSQFNRSDSRSSARIYGSTIRSSFGSHDGSRGIPSSEGSAENSFDFVISEEKRSHGVAAAPESSVHRIQKRNSSTRSRTSPPVHLALKTHREMVDDDSVEDRTICSSPLVVETSPTVSSTPKATSGSAPQADSSGPELDYGSQQGAEGQPKFKDVGQLAELFTEHVNIRARGEIRYPSECSPSSIPALANDDRVPVEDQKIAKGSDSAAIITEKPLRRNIPQIADVRLVSSCEASTLVQARVESTVSTCGRFELSKLDVLSEEIWYYHKAIIQTECVLNRKLHLRDVLYYAISPVFPMCGLYVVGSSLNGFGTNSSDMDLCLMITNKELDQRTDAVVVLNMIQSALAETKWVAAMQLIIAKVPILRLRFNEPFTDITVDLNANNSVAIRNTHLLCYYSSFDWRVRPLVSVVKEWAKRRDINDANRSSFTSYSLVLMVIHYLQCGLKQPILPSLQVVYPKRFSGTADVRSLNVSNQLEQPQDWVTNETITLGELLIGFLEYYAFKFDYLKDAISVRLGRKTARTVVARQPSPYNSNIAQWNCICIEEPFTLSNTAHSVHNQMVFDAIRQAFVDGFYELDTNRDLKAFLDVGPINISIGSSSTGSSAQLSTLAQSEASSPPSSGDATLTSKNLLLISPESNKEEEYELVEADEPPPLVDCDLESEVTAAIPFERTRQCHIPVSDEIELTDVGCNDAASPETVMDLVENMAPMEMDPRSASTVPVDDEVSMISCGQITKSVLCECQPKGRQPDSPSGKSYVDAVLASFGEQSLLQKGENRQQPQIRVGKAVIAHRRRKGGGHRGHGSMGRASGVRSNVGKSCSNHPEVPRISYHSGATSS